MAEGDNPASAAPATAASTSKDERMWNMLCHLTALSGFVGVPFGNLLGPFLIWQIKKNEFPSVEAHAKESLNFQISLLIYLIGGSLVLVIPIVTIFLIPVLIIAGGLTGIILSIIAGLKANNGEAYRYPLTIRFLK